MFNNKSILIGMTILLMIISPCIFAIDNDTQNNSIATTKGLGQNKSKNKANNNSISIPERQEASQRHNLLRVGPVPDEPNVEPMCSHAL